jgi:hypothetical protein
MVCRDPIGFFAFLSASSPICCSAERFGGVIAGPCIYRFGLHIPSDVIYSLGAGLKSALKPIKARLATIVTGTTRLVAAADPDVDFWNVC